MPPGPGDHLSTHPAQRARAGLAPAGRHSLPAPPLPPPARPRPTGKARSLQTSRRCYSRGRAPGGEARAAAPRWRGGASPLPRSPRLGSTLPGGGRPRVAPRHPRQTELSSQAREGVCETHRPHLFYVHDSAPLAGEKASPPRSDSAAVGSNEAPTRPLPQSAARSRPAKQNGGARGGGVRALNGTILAVPAERRGSRGPVFSLLLAKEAF